MGWLSWLLTMAALIALWKLAFANSGLIASWLWRNASLGFGMLTNSTSFALGNLINAALAWSFFFWMIGLGMSILSGSLGKVGVWLRNLPFSLAVRAFRSIPGLLSRLWRGVMVISGLARAKMSGAPRSKEKGGSGS